MSCGENDSQRDQSYFQTVLQEYPLLAFRPLDVVIEDGHLNLLAIWNRNEKVEESPD